MVNVAIFTANESSARYWFDKVTGLMSHAFYEDDIDVIRSKLRVEVPAKHTRVRIMVEEPGEFIHRHRMDIAPFITFFTNGVSDEFFDTYVKNYGDTITIIPNASNFANFLDFITEEKENNNEEE